MRATEIGLDAGELETCQRVLEHVIANLNDSATTGASGIEVHSVVAGGSTDEHI